MVQGPGSSLAQTRFAQPHHPENKSFKQAQSRPAQQLDPSMAGGGRSVDFAPPIYHEHEGFYYSDSQEDHEGSEGSFEGGSAEDMQGAGFEDDDEEDEMEVDDQHEQEGEQVHPHDEEAKHIAAELTKPQSAGMSTSDDRVLQPISPAAAGARANQAQQQAALGVGRPGQLQTASAVQESSVSEESRPGPTHRRSIDEQLREEQEALDQERLQSRTPLLTPSQGQQRSPSTSSTSSRLKPFFDDLGQDGKADETRKISLTPTIARENSMDSRMSDRAPSPGGSQARVHVAQQSRQAQRDVSNASSAHSIATQGDYSGFSTTSSMSGPSHGLEQHGVQERRGSGASTESGSSISKEKDTQKRKSGSMNADQSKKKKSSGILGGLFSRSKKDKEKDKEKDKDKDKKDRRDSSGSSGNRKSSVSSFGSDDDRRSSMSSPAPGQSGSAPVQGIVTQQLAQRRATEAAREGMFGTDAALKQQQIEAQNVMLQQYGIQPRATGDVRNNISFAASRPLQTTSNSLANASSTSQGHLTTSSGPRDKSRRPGSLIGSPHMAGGGASAGDVPILNVLRVFAGENIYSDATFKTVLLNETTTTEELVKQAMQRFHLSPPASAVNPDGSIASENILAEFFLTAKEASGDETVLEIGQRPLEVFEGLSEVSGLPSGNQGLPSVKRSSVGSISSIASNLTFNPAIEKLKMSDFSDDSSVKLFINKRSPDPRTRRASVLLKADEAVVGISDDMVTADPNRLSATGSIIDRGPAPGMPSSPLLRFAVRVLIHPQDLPDSMAFDPNSPAIITKATLADRHSHPAQPKGTEPVPYREKIIFFPRNVNVSEVLEASLDRFGILEGVVDGGDDVEDKVSKRRSVSRIRYTLSMRLKDSPDEETVLGPSSKVIEAYSQPPLYRNYDRNSKEFRRRSMDAPWNTPSVADLQPSDPTFVIRRANFRQHQTTSSGDSMVSGLGRPRPSDRSVSSASTATVTARTGSPSVYATPMSEVPPEVERRLSPQQTQREIIAAQRAASQAEQQRRMTLARKNSFQGVDVIMSDRSTIRSSKDSTNTMRYSYIGVDGIETDISDIVESEWKHKPQEPAADQEEYLAQPESKPIPMRTPSAMSQATSDSYQSALSSPMTPLAPSGFGHIRTPSQTSSNADRAAIDKLATACVNIDGGPDLLQETLSKRAASPALSQESTNGGVDERLDRVLARVKAGGGGGVASGIASALRSHQQSQQGSIVNASQSSGIEETSRSASATLPRDASPSMGQSSPTPAMTRSRSGSSSSAGHPPWQNASSFRSTPQSRLAAVASSASSTPRAHSKQPSIGSVHSEASSVASPSTTVTTSAANTSVTAQSSMRNESSLAGSVGRLPVPYRDNHGLDFLLAMIQLEAPEPPLPKQRRVSPLEALSDIPFPDVSAELAPSFAKSRQRLDNIDARLDEILARLVNV